MNEDLKKSERDREQLSALMDGQLHGDDWLQALHCAEQEEGRATWHVYHVVGDALRSTELAAHGASSGAFLARFEQRLSQEPVLTAVLEKVTAQQVVQAPVPQAANAAVFRWKMLAGLASLAVVASVGWNSWDRLQSGGASTAGTQLAIAMPAPAAVNHLAADVDANVTLPAMIRDPRLDELLAAHKQFGGTSALQMPAGFLRNATFEAPAR